MGYASARAVHALFEDFPEPLVYQRFTNRVVELRGCSIGDEYL